jgi:hypothetical protein
MAFTLQGLASIQGVGQEEIRLIPVSATRDMHQGGEGVGELRDRLKELVRERGEEVSREAALRRLNGVADELRARLEVEERAIHLSGATLEDRLEGLGELRRELALRREEIQPILMDSTRRLVETATASLRERAGGVRAAVERALQACLVAEAPRGGNGALVQAITGELQTAVSGVFDAWWAENEEEVRGRLREAMTRAARGVDATGSTLTAWVEEELGVTLPTPPPPLDLVESHDFYYRVQGLRPELTVDFLWLLLPRFLFQGWIRRKIPRLVAKDLELNVGRIRGDLLYRFQETMRGFFAELNRRALAAEEGVRTALMRALEAQAGEREGGAVELERLVGGKDALERILARVGKTDPALASVPEDQQGGEPGPGKGEG